MITYLKPSDDDLTIESTTTASFGTYGFSSTHSLLATDNVNGMTSGSGYQTNFSTNEGTDDGFSRVTWGSGSASTEYHDGAHETIEGTYATYNSQGMGYASDYNEYSQHATFSFGYVYISWSGSSSELTGYESEQNGTNMASPSYSYNADGNGYTFTSASFSGFNLSSVDEHGATESSGGEGASYSEGYIFFEGEGNFSSPTYSSGQTFYTTSGHYNTSSSTSYGNTAGIGKFTLFTGTISTKQINGLTTAITDTSVSILTGTYIATGTGSISRLTTTTVSSNSEVTSFSSASISVSCRTLSTYTAIPTASYIYNQVIEMEQDEWGFIYTGHGDGDIVKFPDGFVSFTTYKATLSSFDIIEKIAPTIFIDSYPYPPTPFTLMGQTVTAKTLTNDYYIVSNATVQSTSYQIGFLPMSSTSYGQYYQFTSHVNNTYTIPDYTTTKQGSIVIDEWTFLDTTTTEALITISYAASPPIATWIDINRKFNSSRNVSFSNVQYGFTKTTILVAPIVNFYDTFSSTVGGPGWQYYSEGALGQEVGETSNFLIFTGYGFGTLLTALSVFGPSLSTGFQIQPKIDFTDPIYDGLAGPNIPYSTNFFLIGADGASVPFYFSYSTNTRRTLYLETAKTSTTDINYTSSYTYKWYKPINSSLSTFADSVISITSATINSEKNSYTGDISSLGNMLEPDFSAGALYPPGIVYTDEGFVHAGGTPQVTNTARTLWYLGYFLTQNSVGDTQFLDAAELISSEISSDYVRVANPPVFKAMTFTTPVLPVIITLSKNV